MILIGLPLFPTNGVVRCHVDHFLGMRVCLCGRGSLASTFSKSEEELVELSGDFQLCFCLVASSPSIVVPPSLSSSFLVPGATSRIIMWGMGSLRSKAATTCRQAWVKLDRYLGDLSAERALSSAAMKGDLAMAKRILDEVRDVNVNWVRESSGWTPLQRACAFGRDSIVAILLAHPDIDTNSKDESRKTPFYQACFHGHTSCVRLLLKDPRVNVNQRESGEYTPLFWAAYAGHIDTIKAWIASGREMDLGNPEIQGTDAIGVAKREGKTEVLALLVKFRENPEETRHEIRMVVSWYNESAAGMFALVVFLCDGLVRVRITHQDANILKFLWIVRRLPMEIQMIICQNSVGSTKESIPAANRERAFISLAKIQW